MASRYRKKFALPEDFMEILESYSREVLRDQPIDIIEFSYLYFKALEEVSPICIHLLSEYLSTDNFRAPLTNSTTQERAKTFPLTKTTGHQVRRERMKKARTSKKKTRAITMRMEIGSKPTVRKEKSMVKKQLRRTVMETNKQRTHSMKKEKRIVKEGKKNKTTEMKTSSSKTKTTATKTNKTMATRNKMVITD